ncbi:Uncharacterized protein OBRU01_07407, partial [Operophtera brumata]
IQDYTGDLHGISQQVVSKTCRNFAIALAKKAHIVINMPSTVNEQLNTVSFREFRAISNFPTTIGAIDCTLSGGIYTKLDTAKATVVALAVLHNIAIGMNERIDIVRYVRRRRARPLNPPGTLRGNVVRRDFIQNNF